MFVCHKVSISTHVCMHVDVCVHLELTAAEFTDTLHNYWRNYNASIYERFKLGIVGFAFNATDDDI